MKTIKTYYHTAIDRCWEDYERLVRADECLKRASDRTQLVTAMIKRGLGPEKEPEDEA